jgi:phosphonate transport system ATP-binding protein
VHLGLHGATVRLGGRTVLDGVSLAVAPGEAVGLIGPSGAGKTTLLRLLDGSRTPDEGSATVDGRDRASLSPAEARAVRSRVGFVHQHLALVPNVRVVHNVLAGGVGRLGWLGVLRGVLLPPADAVEEAHRILVRVGIGDLLYQRTDRLSGGEQQRVAVARALYQRPAVLLADEPVSSLDPARAEDTLQWLVELGRTEGLGLVVSLHDVELARRCLPRLLLLREGRVEHDGRPDALPQP